MATRSFSSPVCGFKCFPLCTRAALNMHVQYTKWDAFSLHPRTHSICAVCMGMCSFFTHSQGDASAVNFVARPQERFTSSLKISDFLETRATQFHLNSPLIVYSAAKVPNNINGLGLLAQTRGVLFFKL
jgi:hypothetical protein